VLGPSGSLRGLDLRKRNRDATGNTHSVGECHHQARFVVNESLPSGTISDWAAFPPVQS
jgi:hypothetical protein